MGNRRKFMVRHKRKKAFMGDFGSLPYNYNIGEGGFAATAYEFASETKYLELVRPTGKVDKNGDEIFDGHLLNVYGRSLWVMKVEWQDELCGYVFKKSNGVTLPMNTKYEVEIIGHIKKTPDLFN